MKKEVSLSARVLSAILSLLLCAGMIANIGIMSAFAEEYDENSSVYVGEIEAGDIIADGAVIYADDEDGGYKTFDVYFNNKLEVKAETEMTFDRRAMLIDAKADSKNSKKLTMYFEDMYTEGNADSEGTLKAVLGNDRVVNLSGDIELKNTIYVLDGKTHIINTNGHTIYAAKSSGESIFSVGSGSTLIIKGKGGENASMITGANNGFASGGAVFVSGNSKLVMQKMSIVGNKAKQGGGVFLKGGTAEFKDCKFENNSASGNGGGLYVDSGASATMNKCKFAVNSANDGGGIYNLGTVTLNNCELTCNSVKGGGAGIWSKGDASLNKTSITQNTNAVNGGGVTNHKDMTLANCTITGNGVTQWGGGLFIDTNGKTVLENDCEISNNTAATGAGINIRNGKLTVSNTVIDKNIASSAGGGVWANSGTNLEFKNVDMNENSCNTNGGGINSHGTVELNSCNIKACMAGNAGGGVYMDSSNSLTIEKSEIVNCTARDGGGVYVHDGSIILAGGIIRITDNTAGGNSNNIKQRDYRNIKITGRLSSGSEIGIVPPTNRVNSDITTGFGEHNDNLPANVFNCDNNECKINRDKNCKEVRLLAGLKSTHSSYKVKVEIKVTDDVDWWDWAYFEIYGKDNRGTGGERHLNTSGDFHGSIDDDGESYSYEYDCGSDCFPSAVNFKTKFGSLWTSRRFQGDVKIYINGINVCNYHVDHKVWSTEEKNTKINIGGDKYPCPDPDGFDIDGPNKSANSGTIEIAQSGIITVAAVDQYGLKWKFDGDKTSMENISYPDEDTFKAVDKTGSKWKLTSTHKTNHMSTYYITFKSGSDVYPKITKVVNFRFVFPLHLSVVVGGKEIFYKEGYEKDELHVPPVEAPLGHYILKYTNKGVGIHKKNSDGSIDFTFVNESVTLTAQINPNNYKVSFDKNGRGVTGYMSNLTLYYDKKESLPENALERDGYEFVGWNTSADGTGKMFQDQEEILNLTAKKGEKIKLYAIWKEIEGSTTASIFSEGTIIIYIGIAVLLLSIAAAVIYSVRKKKQKEQNGKS